MKYEELLKQIETEQDIEALEKVIFYGEKRKREIREAMVKDPKMKLGLLIRNFHRQDRPNGQGYTWLEMAEYLLENGVTIKTDD